MRDLEEAAEVDGAGWFMRFFTVTLPLLRPALLPAVILGSVWTFNMFNVIYLVSEGQPAGANEILITKSYKIAFEEYRYGYAAAYSVVIFLILLGLLVKYAWNPILDALDARLEGLAGAALRARGRRA